jgi:hypothetical protein
MLTHERLTELLTYDPDTGIFRWRQRRAAMRVGEIAGTIRPDGRNQICLDRMFYFASRLAWFYVYGKWPSALIDHKNGKRHQDQIANLREADYCENMRNIHSGPTNKTGVRGVYFEPRTGRYYAQIRLGGKTAKALGTFDTLEEAAAVRKEAVRRLHGEFASPLDQAASGSPTG